MKKLSWFAGILLISNAAYAEPSTPCPSANLCPKFEDELERCAKNRKSKPCGEFVELFRKLAPKYDCKRSFDTRPVPAVWLCDEGKIDFPKPYEKGVSLLSKLKSKKARAFFGSDELRSTMDGAIAEEFMDKSKALKKNRHPGLE